MSATSPPAGSSSSSSSSSTSTSSSSERSSRETLLLQLFGAVGRDHLADRITCAQLQQALALLQLPWPETLVREMFDDADTGGAGSLGYPELLAYVRRRDEAHMQVAFEAWQRRTSGGGASTVISATELQRSLEGLGLDADEVHVARFVESLDSDANGEVSLQEFQRFLVLLPPRHRLQDMRAVFETWLLHEQQQQTQTRLHQAPVPQPSTAPAIAPAPPAAAAAAAAACPATASTAATPAPPPAARPTTTNPAIVLLAGALAGIASRTATAPLDRLKILMQVGPPRAVRRPMQLGGMVSGLREIYQAGGLASFWQGNGANVVKVMPESAIKFWGYDFVKKGVCADFHAPTASERLLAGAGAGAMSCVAIYPLEVVKTRMAVAKPAQYDGILHCIQRTIRLEGASALYKGLTASLIGIIPFSAVDLALYNTLKDKLRHRRQRAAADAARARRPDEPPPPPPAELGVVAMLGCGAASSTVAQLITYPLALAKTRLQVAGMPGRSPEKHLAYGRQPPVRPEYDGLVDCLTQTVRAEGPRGLYRGIIPNMLKAVPAMAISYSVFETSKRLLLEREAAHHARQHAASGGGKQAL